jgi:hypothetical protein
VNNRRAWAVAMPRPGRPARVPLVWTRGRTSEPCTAATDSAQRRANPLRQSLNGLLPRLAAQSAAPFFHSEGTVRAGAHIFPKTTTTSPLPLTQW